MNTKALLIVIFLFSFHSSLDAQKNFLPAQIEKVNGEKTKGYINYQNWDKNPKTIDFRQSLDGVKQSYSPKELKEFSVKDEKYISAEVETEVSPFKTSSLEYGMEPKIKKQVAFLQAIIEGEKGLYYFKDANDKENFYISNEGELELLIYKRYFKDEKKGKAIAENKKYIGQLNYHLQSCSSLKNKTAQLNYNKSSLEQLFLKYYHCNSIKTQFHRKPDKIKIKFGVVGGVSMSSIKFRSPLKSVFNILLNSEFEKSINPTAGIFFNIILPRTRERWSSYNEILYSSYKTKGVLSNNIYDTRFSNTISEFDFSYINFHNLFRYKHQINKLNLFFNFGVSHGVSLKHSTKKRVEVIENGSLTNVQEFVPILQGTRIRKLEQGLIGGLGIQYNNFSIEFRYKKRDRYVFYRKLGSTTERYLILAGHQF